MINALESIEINKSWLPPSNPHYLRNNFIRISLDENPIAYLRQPCGSMMYWNVFSLKMDQ